MFAVFFDTIGGLINSSGGSNMKAIEKAKEVQKADRRRYDRKNTKARINNVIVDNLIKAVSKKHPEPEKKIQRKVHIEQAIVRYTKAIENDEVNFID